MVMAYSRVHWYIKRLLASEFILKELPTGFPDVSNESRGKKGEFKESTKFFGLSN